MEGENDSKPVAPAAAPARSAAMSQAMKTVPVRYIGPKPRKIDNVCYTDVIWDGFGDVQEVPVAVAQKLLVPKFRSIWQNAEDAPPERPEMNRVKDSTTRATAALEARNARLGNKKPEAAFDVVEKDRIIEALGELITGKVASEFKPLLDNGNPNIEAVNAVLGKKINPTALAQAWDEIMQYR